MKTTRPRPATSGHAAAPAISALRSPGMIVVLAATALIIPAGPRLHAQGLTTAAVHTTVRSADGSGADGAHVVIVNTATGFRVEGEVRHGIFLAHGLEVGGPYTITVRRLGFLPEQREGILLTLGERLDLRFMLQPTVIALDPIRIARPFPSANAHGGTATTIPDSLLHRLPTMDRGLYDFVRLVPQISTRIGFAPGGMSGGGVGFRFNSFLIDGVSERSVPGSQPPEFAGGRSVPLEAIAEYQVLLAPFDVRYGDFAGALVNAVTRSGTNEFHGSVFAYARNDALARRGQLGDSDPYERLQYGFSFGGPLRRDRVHFFLTPELQHRTSPSRGPYVGQRNGRPPVPVSVTDLTRLDEIMRGYGLTSGSGAAVENRNALQNLFSRFDVAIPEWGSRVVLSLNHARTRNLAFSRDASNLFPLSTHTATQAFGVQSATLQLHTALRRGGGGHHELTVSHRATPFRSLSDTHQPIVRVAALSTTGGLVTIITGTPVQAQSLRTRVWSLSARDNLTLPFGASHVATFGLEGEWFGVRNEGVLNSYGTWTFSSLDSLEFGIAERYERARDFGSANVPVTGGQFAAYAGDQIRMSDRVSITVGVRADMLVIFGRAPYNPVVDSIFQRRTDETPRRRVHLSPRAGITWDVSGTGRHQLRGGVGIFTGRPPIAWLHSALSSYGVGIGQLRCGVLPTDLGPPPGFVPDHQMAPSACADGAELSSAPRGNVDLLDSRLRMAQTLRFSLAYDRRLPGDLLGTVEALVTRNISDFAFVNLNLGEPLGRDRYGRLLYGTIGPTGLSQPALRSNFSEVIELRNTSRNHAYQLSTRLDKQFSRGLAATGYYTFTRARDVQTPLRVNTPGLVNWSSRAVSGRHDELRPEISLNDVPHRIVLAGTYRAPWRSWSTQLSLYYVGESGSPFTYLAWGVGRRGDLNADGSSMNDPIYVPRSAFDATEIQLSGRSDEPGADNSPVAQAERVSRQQAALERFIEGSPCLRRQRGSILKRNSCREPWSHTTIASVRQAVPVVGRGLEAQLDVFNVLNLLKRDWGLHRVGSPALLEHVGQTAAPAESAQPIFRFDEAAMRWTRLPAESSFQLQLALRYRF